MSVIQHHAREFGNVDTLLRDFFRAEMPDPWPTMKAPVEAKFAPSARPVPRRWVRGKLALAASVTLLMVGSWCLSGGSGPDYSQPAGESPLSGRGDADSHFLKDILNGKKLNGTPKKTPEGNNKGCSGCDCCK